MVGDAVEHGGGHLGVAEDLGPVGEGEVGGDDDRGNLPYTLSFVGGDAIISIGSGDQMILVGVANSSLLGAAWLH